MTCLAVVWRYLLCGLNFPCFFACVCVCVGVCVGGMWEYNLALHFLCFRAFHLTCGFYDEVYTVLFWNMLQRCTFVGLHFKHAQTFCSERLRVFPSHCLYQNSLIWYLPSPLRQSFPSENGPDAKNSIITNSISIVWHANWVFQSKCDALTNCSWGFVFCKRIQWVHTLAQFWFMCTCAILTILVSP